MSPQRLALRTLLLGRPRSVLAILLIAACLCLLDLFAGNIASVRARLEYQAVTGERLGHLAITGAVPAGALPFEPAEAKRIKQLAEAVPGVALVVPQMSVSGIASTGQRSALFNGEGIGGADGARRGGEPEPAGKLNPAQLDSERTVRLVVYLADPKQLDAARLALLGVLRRDGQAVDIRTWRESSPSYLKARDASDLTFDSLAGMVFAVIAAAIAATISMNALERRREVATLRALGMRSSGVFVMFAAEALWMAAFAVVLSLVGSGLIAWIVNRVALSLTTRQALKQGPMLFELDFNRMLMAVLTVMAVALLAALVPAFKAARVEVAEGLSGSGV